MCTIIISISHYYYFTIIYIFYIEVTTYSCTYCIN